MRDELEAVLELFGGMPLGGQQHWRERSLPSVEFGSDEERQEFLAELDALDKPPEQQERASSDRPTFSSSKSLISLFTKDAPP